jgi:hypothetical protein
MREAMSAFKPQVPRKFGLEAVYAASTTSLGCTFCTFDRAGSR